MAVFKCKMCDGALEIVDNQSVAVCEYCGTKQTLPNLDDEKKLALFNRANNLRFKSEFDKAAGIYESIIAEFPEEAEAYWGLVLCKYGIEYVDDPATGRKVPTCHRTITTSVLDDENFELAYEYADFSAKMLYREEAKAINEIQKKIFEIVATEEPYDIFICYKESDPITGLRTDDSTIAQDVYTELIKEGYKVFFARVTLRDKAGSEYEPYIYSALSSAKVMLAFGTKYEYFDAVWVKNEWSRYLSMMATDKTKHFIACCKDLVAEDIPKEFRQLQALNINDVTFIKSLFANVKGFIPKGAVNSVNQAVVNNGVNVTIDSLLKRAYLFLEDEQFESAKEYFEKVLDAEPENADAYAGKLLVKFKCANWDSIIDKNVPLDLYEEYDKIIRFGDEALKTKVLTVNEKIKDIIDNAKKEKVYNESIIVRKDNTSFEDYYKAARKMKSISGYKDSEMLCQKYIEIGNELKKQEKASIQSVVEEKSKLKRKLTDEQKKIKSELEIAEKKEDKLDKKVSRLESKIWMAVWICLYWVAFYVFYLIVGTDKLNVLSVVFLFGGFIAIFVSRKIMKAKREREDNKLCAAIKVQRSKISEINYEINELDDVLDRSQKRLAFINESAATLQNEIDSFDSQQKIVPYVFKYFEVLETDGGYFSGTYRRKGPRFDHKTADYITFALHMEEIEVAQRVEFTFYIFDQNERNIMGNPIVSVIDFEPGYDVYTNCWTEGIGKWAIGRYTLVLKDSYGNCYKETFYID